MGTFEGVVLLHILLIGVISVSGDALCEICACTRTGGVVGQMESIICQTTNRKLFEDDLEWPKGVTRVNLIEFKDMISSVLPM